MNNINSQPSGKLHTVHAAETMRRIYSLPIAEITEIFVRMILTTDYTDFSCGITPSALSVNPTSTASLSSQHSQHTHPTSAVENPGVILTLITPDYASDRLPTRGNAPPPPSTPPQRSLLSPDGKPPA